jgi:hypothetical protein
VLTASGRLFIKFLGVPILISVDIPAVVYDEGAARPQFTRVLFLVLIVDPSEVHNFTVRIVIDFDVRVFSIASLDVVVVLD